MLPNDELEILKNDFIENVLPKLYKTASVQKVRNFGSGIGPNHFYISPSMNTILECAEDYKPKFNSFVHFTNLKALHSILNNLNIRLYNLHNLNDPNEFSLIAREFGFNEFKLKSFKNSIYVFSMCQPEIFQSDNILTHWQKYGNDGAGCAIEFEIDNINTNFSDLKLAKVNYTIPDYSDFFKANKEFEIRHGRETRFSDLIKIPACLHKKPIYKSEEEIRLIFDSDYNIPVSHTFKDGENIKYDFSSKDGSVVTYCSVPLYEDKFSEPSIKIKRIRLGFKISKDLRAMYIEHIQKIFWGIRVKLQRDVETPILEFSNLDKDYK